MQGLRGLPDWSGRAGARSSGCGHIHVQTSGTRQERGCRNDSSARRAKSGVYVRKTGHPRGEGKIPECLRPEAPKERKNLAQCATAGFPSPRTGSPPTTFPGLAAWAKLCRPDGLERRPSVLATVRFLRIPPKPAFPPTFMSRTLRHLPSVGACRIMIDQT